MCDFSEKLIAWLDGELPEHETAAVGLHIEACAECRGRVEAYGQVSRAFAACCDAVMASQARPKCPRWVPVWVPVLSGALAAAAVLFLVFPRARVERRLIEHETIPHEMTPHQLTQQQAAAASANTVAAAASTPTKRIQRRPSAAPVQSQEANGAPVEPAIEIAIPAEALFPPGALPEGVNFLADVGIAADGSARIIQVRPRLIGFERRSNQP